MERYFNPRFDYRRPFDVFYETRAIGAASAPIAIFIRHGLTDLNEADDFRGDLDVPLNADGQKQAQQLVSFFARQRFSALFNSSRSRTAQTIAPLAQSKGLHSTTLKALDSLDTGEFAGKPKNKENKQRMQWYSDHPDAVIPGGESVRGFRDRVDGTLLHLIQQGERSADPIGACVHGSVIKELSRLLHNDPKAFTVEPGGAVGVYEIPGGGYQLRILLGENDTSDTADGTIDWGS